MTLSDAASESVTKRISNHLEDAALEEEVERLTMDDESSDDGLGGSNEDDSDLKNGPKLPLFPPKIAPFFKKNCPCHKIILSRRWCRFWARKIILGCFSGQPMVSDF